MNKTNNIVCIFAHPDDEAFGPSGIIANWVEAGNNVYLICATDGSNPNAGIKELKNIRNSELLKSAKILGIKKVFFLGYCDGELNNNVYHNVANDIKTILDKIKPSALLTFEMRGVSGHIDHIFISMVTTFLYKKLKYAKRLYYFAENRFLSKLMKNYFIYFPDGYSKTEVDHVENIKAVWSKKVEAIKVHESQKHDGKWVLRIKSLLPKEEFFFLLQK